AGVDPRADALAAGLVAAEDRHVVARLHQRAGELPMTAAHVEDPGAGPGLQQLQRRPRLDRQEPGSDGARKTPGVVVGRGLDVRLCQGDRARLLSSRGVLRRTPRTPGSLRRSEFGSARSPWLDAWLSHLDSTIRRDSAAGRCR